MNKSRMVHRWVRFVSSIMFLSEGSVQTDSLPLPSHVIWGNLCISLSLRCLSCKMGIIIILILEDCYEDLAR